MMTYETRDNSGSLFRNDDRQNDNHPNAKGKAMIDGVMYWVSAWTKTAKDGQRWQSLSFTPMEKEVNAKPKAIKAQPEFDASDIPF